MNQLLLASVLLAAARSSVLDHVNVFIGSGGSGFGAGGHNPGAQHPFGILRLGPDTSNDGIILPFDHYGGYSFGDNTVRAFSHTHLVGAGVGDLGNFGLIPFAISSSNLSSLVSHHSVSFSHDEEKATPGQYAVNLSSVANVELVASGSHSGSHYYDYTPGISASTCGVLLDVCHTAMGNGDKTCHNGTVNVTSDSASSGYTEVTASMTMSGSLTERAPSGGVSMYFVARLNFTSMNTSVWKNKVLQVGDSKSGAASGSLGLMLYDACERIAANPLHINVGISFVSIKNARVNLKMQSHQDSLDQATSVWTDLLSRVVVDETSSPVSTTADTTSSDLLTKFYTSMYHTYLAPSSYDDSNGEYLSFGSPPSKVNKVGEASQDQRKHAYTDMSIWDIHRTQLPWLSLTVPDVYTDVLASLQFMAMEGSGDIPRWPLLNIYTGCMIGSHAWVSLVESILKNQHDKLNTTYLFESMIAGATTERAHSGRIAVQNYTTLGYVPSELDKQSASLTLSYAFDDAAVATMAKFLGKNEVAEIFNNRSLAAYKHLWSKDRLLLCPKSHQTGHVNCPLDEALPYPFETTYVEGDALQWLWFVPHDPDGLASLFPSSKAYVARLESFMHKSLSPKEGGEWIGGTFLANAWYWAGNEPNILAPWMFSFGGKEYHNYTAYWTRYLVDHQYSVSGKDGLPGNDDFGTLSAWLTWSVLGFYPMAGTSTFIVGAPRFARVCIHRDVGALCVVGHNVSNPTFTHVEKCMLNGVLLDTPFFDWQEIAKGNSTIEFWMSDRPGQWG